MRRAFEKDLVDAERDRIIRAYSSGDVSFRDLKVRFGYSVPFLRRVIGQATKPKTPPLDKAPRRREVLAFIEGELAAGRPFPTPTRIADHMGWRQSSSATDALLKLVIDCALKCDLVDGKRFFSVMRVRAPEGERFHYMTRAPDLFSAKRKPIPRDAWLKLRAKKHDQLKAEIAEERGNPLTIEEMAQFEQIAPGADQLPDYLLNEPKVGARRPYWERD